MFEKNKRRGIPWRGRHRTPMQRLLMWFGRNR